MLRNRSLPPKASESISDSAPDALLAVRIEAYLDSLFASWKEAVDPAQYESLREEMRLHLEELVRAYRAAGVAPSEAFDRAILQFGAPQQVATEWEAAVQAPGKFGASFLAALKSHAKAFVLPCVPIATLFLLTGGQSSPVLRTPLMEWTLMAMLLLPLVAAFRLGMRGRRGAVAASMLAMAATVGTVAFSNALFLWSMGWIDAPMEMISRSLNCFQALIPLCGALTCLGGRFRALRQERTAKPLLS